MGSCQRVTSIASRMAAAAVIADNAAGQAHRPAPRTGAASLPQ
jgi:hypothetical protein